MSAKDFLTAAEQKIVDAFNAEVTARETRAYNQALINVAGILCWLTAKPGLTKKQLGRYVMSEFDRAAESLPADASIRNQLTFYRDLIT